MKFVYSLFLLLTMNSVAFAQDAGAAVPPEGMEAIKGLIAAAQGGKWSLFVSLLIMVLVWLATKAPFVRDWIKGQARIWTAAVAGVLGAFATAIFVSYSADGSVDWLSVTMEGLSVGLAAGGLWSLLGRKVLGKPIDADGDGELDSLESKSE